LSFSQTLNRTGIGMCVRDDDGAFVLASTVSFSLICPVSIGEVLGLFYTLEWSSDMQMDKVDYPVESKTTNNAFSS